jgi:two-component system, cell cycle response regulator
MTVEQNNRREGRVLVVDDADDVREVLDLLLRANGFDVVLADGGKAGLQIARIDPIDVILLDVMMPGMDGFEVCRQLKASPSTASIPVILLTARDDMQARADGMNLGVSEFLAKPVDHEELLRRLRTQVGARRRERELAQLEQRTKAAGAGPAQQP